MAEQSFRRLFLSGIPVHSFYHLLGHQFHQRRQLDDGLDGLAAGVTGIASIAVIIVAVHQGYFPVATVTAALAGAIIGFIHYNFNPATIFMGDTGSMFIGYMLAAISVFGRCQKRGYDCPDRTCGGAGPAYHGYGVRHLRRYSNGRPIFQPDKGHLHHRLLAMGLSQRQAVLLMYGISLVLSLAAAVLSIASWYVAAAVIAVVVVAVAIGAKKIGILDDRMN
jgi:UDP-GlcNAc:undecaprenyl-phosphate/decaprenyl-phosphate GlcNAc-1-phosphate transferase